MHKIQLMRYTKDNGDMSEREVIVLSGPKELYLMYDISKLSNKESNLLLETLDDIDHYRDDAITEFEMITGIKQASLWRSFKPGGIEWIKENEI